MSRSYRDRVIAIYEAYAPEKLPTVDNALKKYDGHEEALIETLVQRYGPEPNINNIGGGGGGGGHAAATTTSLQQQQALMAIQGGGAGHLTSVPSAANFGQFGMSQASMVFSPEAGQPPPPPPPELDRYQSVRAMIRDQGFLCREHERAWEEAWMGKIPLRTYKKDWEIENAMLLEGMGQKLSCRARPMRRWQKRYFVLVPPFFYYFEDDKPTTVCKGALYMDRAEVIETEQEGKPEKRILQITSRVSKKPAELDPNGSYSTFQICFDSARQQATWLTALQQVAAIPPKASAAATAAADASFVHPSPAASLYNLGAASPGRFLAVGPGAVAAPGSPLALHQLHIQQQQASSADTLPSGAAAATPQPAAAPKLTVEITTDDIRRRVARLMAERDPQAMCDLLLGYFSEHVRDPNLWWHFMNKVEEEAPVTRDRFGATPRGALPPVMDRFPPLDLGGGSGGGGGGGSGATRRLDLAAPGTADDSREMTYAAADAGASSVRGGGAFQPQQQAQPQSAATSVSDASWQSRMDRLKARRSAVERILNDVPGTM